MVTDAAPAPIPIDTAASRKARGAFFTPQPIAELLTDWAIAHRPNASVLDPTCGDGVFLLAAGRRLHELGASREQLNDQVVGVDIHHESLTVAQKSLQSNGLAARTIHSDFFAIDAPEGMFPTLPRFDAIVGNPPFIRYHHHVGDARQRSVRAALGQGVRLSGLASSWAAVLVHAVAFLKPDGRLAMVLPAELLTVGYAEPIRKWLRQRFAVVKLTMFDELQFDGALENVVLLTAHGKGGCNEIRVDSVRDSADLDGTYRPTADLTPVADDTKWTGLLLSTKQRELFIDTVAEHFVTLRSYGPTELGTVTGANSFFALNEHTRRNYRLAEQAQVSRICPPGTRHLRRPYFTQCDWEILRDAAQPVWLLYPDPSDRSEGLRDYVESGEASGVPRAYKCRIRTPWWRPPMVSAPDLFFTYMSHRYPRLIANEARVSFVNSMHGVRLRSTTPKIAMAALPILMFNSVSLLGAETQGRSYGGGVLKLEPREAAALPLPSPSALNQAWSILSEERAQLAQLLADGRCADVIRRVDDVLLRVTLRLSRSEVATLHEASIMMQSSRLTRTAGHARS